MFTDTGKDDTKFAKYWTWLNNSRVVLADIPNSINEFKLFHIEIKKNLTDKSIISQAELLISDNYN